MGIAVKVMENGRMVLPIAIRRQLGLEKGGTLIIEGGDTEVTLRTLDQTLDKVRTAFAAYADLPGTSVDDFLANRRADSGE
ncbi:AbrB/MazE/SpoVT family DNA-binding domain-containing protein [Porphyrobacter sp. GA68]|uniref:AbrB/MazE/SpoVT family DNA-binding domain-containing protein n=1 Tax=Porphyrobacter sp. GA68 TaxID=2883480 RepID=UPI001D182EA8|nr:AbrB/MazE/SpoVT family DNA-binding domain-containing protein [Porphyrobacter sp. GA68]